VALVVEHRDWVARNARGEWVVRNTETGALSLCVSKAEAIQKVALEGKLARLGEPADPPLDGSDEHLRGVINRAIRLLQYVLRGLNERQ